MSSRARFTGQVALITGASSGVGAELARVLSAEGAAVTLVARKQAALDELAAGIEASGGQALAVAADVRDAAEVDFAVSQTLERFGRLDVAVPSAGVGRVCRLEDLDAGRWSEYIDVNLTGTFNVCRSAGLHMRTQGSGVIVTVASGMGLHGAAGYAAYCASKGGVVLLTKALALELAPAVRVNCFAPGGIDTPMTDDDFEQYDDPAAARAEALDHVPLKRLASAWEIAIGIAWLASSEAAYATGSIVSADGGTTAR